MANTSIAAVIVTWVYKSLTSPGSHYKHITFKAYKYLGLLRCAFSSCHSVKAKKILYITLRSHLTYCSQLWNPYLTKDTITLEKIQRKATKFIIKDYDTDYQTRLPKLDLLPLKGKQTSVNIINMGMKK